MDGTTVAARLGGIGETVAIGANAATGYESKPFREEGLFRFDLIGFSELALKLDCSPMRGVLVGGCPECKRNKSQ
ncbi:Hypothetical protein NGAL_HAMBI2427_42130 [Neorhizobium galegae bv. orientalis]|uniref:Uncharacterized protein n=1 Tax=Neorhizobium galegae bv. orientalis str. HAMBI 540 TaxID=1028800 RepID=A0A068T1L6_NEOGA|nr:Hypothetical protein RG540_PA12550 [Neorhizobium galegae bv. orientalis str. HAMBI 540]CDZ51562.1 Hypothetical protein NGAL_HAMBI2427_42130 [Neorhizobium galegae bv. orientalis]